MNKCIIFGLSCFSDLVANYIEAENQYEIIAYTVNEKYLKSNFYNGKPVIAFEKLPEIFDMSDIYLINTVGYSKMNSISEKIFEESKKMQFKIGSFISKKAVVYTSKKNIGVGNIILPLSHIGYNVHIGNNNIIFSGVNLTHEIEVGNNNFIASGTTVGGYVKIKNNCFLGMNSTIKNRITLNDKTLVGASAYIHKDSEKNGVYVPNRSIKLDKDSIFFI